MNASERRQCFGFPKGHYCPVEIPADRLWCHSCLELRQRALSAGYDESPQPVGIILRRLDEGIPTCICGGRADVDHHERSLLHIEFEWKRFEQIRGRG